MWIKRKVFDRQQVLLAEAFAMHDTLRTEIDSQAARIVQYTAGADPTPVPEMLVATPAQFWWRMLQLDADTRHKVIAEILDAREVAGQCLYVEDHQSLKLQLAVCNDQAWRAQAWAERLAVRLIHLEDVRRAALDSRPQSVKWGTVEIPVEFG